jgi:ABC-type sugar transport system permease subunit
LPVRKTFSVAEMDVGVDVASGRSGWHPGPALWFLFSAAAILIVVYAGPPLFAFHASFTAWSLVDPGSDKIYVGLDTYRDVLTSREYWRAVTVTLSYALTAVALELVLGTAFALLLKLDFLGRSLFRSLMIIPIKHLVRGLTMGSIR